jgi:hypothetical protein
MLPYLVIKRDRALLALQFQREKRPGGRHCGNRRSLSVEACEGFRDRMRKLNARGVDRQATPHLNADDAAIPLLLAS